LSDRTVLVCGAVMCGLLASQTASGQTWSPARNAFGQPDLEGVWLSNTATPLERPKALEGRASLTNAEVAEFKRRAARLFNEAGGGDFAVGDGIFQALLANPERYTNPNATHGAEGMSDLAFDNRTSLIVGRPDGRLPAVSAEGRRRQAAVAEAFRRPAEPADIGNALRCVSWGVPRLGGRYGAGDLSYYQIVQAPGHVVLYAETGHEARVIPLDDRPHVDARLSQWNGDSRGHWEGNTLVVETKRFSSKSYFMGATDGLSVVESFTRTAPNAMEYRITLADPAIWASSWSAMMPLQQRDETLYEFACHEGNFHIMRGMLDGSRLEQEAERAAATRR
jgi:hypothetical protein